MAKQPKLIRKTPADLRLERMKQHIDHAQWIVARSPLGRVLEAVAVTLCEGQAGDPLPQFGCVDPVEGVVWLNPRVRPENELSAEEWAFVLAHQLLHLALNHAQRGVRCEPMLWNAACEYTVNNLLRALQIGAPPPDFQPDTTFAGKQEEVIYEQLLENAEALQRVRTFAGLRRPDIVERKRPVYETNSQKKRPDYEALFALGIREAVESAVEQAAATQGETATRTRGWSPMEQAKRWVMTEFPLLGALAAQVTIIAKADLCQRMDISIAAVNGFLMEMYVNPTWDFTRQELLFIYTHELLHVALMHHARLQGRDPLIWNYACDFVINGWLIEMGVGTVPRVGLLYDPRLQGMSAEEVYDLLARDPKRCKGLRGFRGKLGDVLLDTPTRRLYKDDVTTLDDIIRRCMAAGMACQGAGRGLVPAGLIEEIRSLFTPPVPWDVELARWMDAHVPLLRDPLRSYARASRRQASTPDIPRPARYVPQEWKEACTFGVVMDTSGSMDREMLGRALGAIASYAEARDVPALRLVLCDAAPYDKGIVIPAELRGIYPIQGRGGTVLQPAINFLLGRSDFPANAPVMVITDGWCEEELLIPRPHCFLLPRKGYSEGAVPLRTSAPVFRVLKEERFGE